MVIAAILATISSAVDGRGPLSTNAFVALLSECRCKDLPALSVDWMLFSNRRFLSVALRSRFDNDCRESFLGQLVEHAASPFPSSDIQSMSVA
uniref:Secreted protein n=1 Tax=Ascaris lumbricoides TaxID=6252 RepID=A0A0M3I748_ASCLU